MDDITRILFEEDLGEQAAEALDKALRECEVTEGFRLEVGDWKLEAEIVWRTSQCPPREVWKGWACFRVHLEKRPERILPLLSIVNEGEVTFPNLEQVAEAICQMG